ncbi:dipeptidase E [Floricoccus penangensis]|uniref:Dipeptidase E n=1 Tax=Floricoccus penangensis TaxID=1859475 RepID=A0A9Q5JIB4_9LACT|nr:Type 1 glutamine amidotransferase-like domain-containing protein [Floricoccus penangensis]OFI47799.1 dipeptidase E [Floricoccus penangensis]
MPYFLTSSPIHPDKDELNSANNFVTNLEKYLNGEISGLFICSDPDSYEMTDKYSASMRDSFVNSGFSFVSFHTLDNRNKAQAKDLVVNSDLIILAGGYPPLQNSFFNDINLKNLLSNQDKVIVGFSAGSMNSAEIVYAQPEFEGEATSKDYQRFYPGLALTKVMILPHYQDIKDEVLDGMKLFEEITYPDSFGRKFYAFNDGTYLLGDDNSEKIYGQSYLISEGVISQLSGDDEIYQLS